MKKYSRIFILISVIVLAFYLFSCGCGKLAEKAAQEATKKALEEAQKEIEKNQPSSPTTPTSTQPSTTTSTGKMTDEIFVELSAYDQYLSWMMEEGKIQPTEFKPLRDAKYKSYGVTDKDYMEFVSNTVSKDAKHYAKLMEKVDARLKELKKK
ncbi:MAG: hypothetical protein PHV06_01635 [bacterium]|nr:hypothetical protein [bacterium]